MKSLHVCVISKSDIVIKRIYIYEVRNHKICKAIYRLMNLYIQLANPSTPILHKGLNPCTLALRTDNHCYWSLSCWQKPSAMSSCQSFPEAKVRCERLDNEDITHLSIKLKLMKFLSTHFMIQKPVGNRSQCSSQDKYQDEN